MPSPVQIADIRSRSVSKQAQHWSPKLRTIPRGVRLSLGNPSPRFRASNTDVKNEKLVSTKSAHAPGAPLASSALPGVSATNEEPARRNNPRVSKDVRGRE